MTVIRSGSRKWPYRLLLSLFVLTIVAASCGDDDSAGEPATDEPATDEPATDEPADEPAEDDEPADEPADDEPTAEPTDDGAGGTLIVAIDRDPERLDPNFVRSVESETISQAIYDSLITLDRDGDPVPGLASSWSFPDDTTLALELNEGVTFHNGETFDAQSVVVSVNRIQDEEHGSHLLNQFASIESVEVVDDYNVNLNLSQPDATLIYALTRLMMIPPEYFAEVGDEGVENAPVGTGPFMFVSYTVDDQTVVERNPDYWPDSPKGQPMVDEVRIRVIPEATVRVAELTTGGIHIADTISADQRSVIEDAGVTLVSFFDGKPQWMIINRLGIGTDAEAASGDEAVQYEALQDPRVALALNHAIDRTAIIDALFGGDAAALGQPFAPGGFGFPDDDEAHAYDPELAMSLLAEAGYADGFHLDILATSASNLDAVVAVMGYLEEIGIRPKLEVINQTIANDRWLSSSYPGLRVSQWNNPETLFGLLIETGGLISVYSDADADALIQQERMTLDVDERVGVLHDITDILHEDPFAIYLWSEPSRVGIDTNATSGWEPHAKGYIPVTGVSLTG